MGWDKGEGALQLYERVKPSRERLLKVGLEKQNGNAQDALNKEGKERKMHVRYSQKAGTGLNVYYAGGIKGTKVGSITAGCWPRSSRSQYHSQRPAGQLLCSPKQESVLVDEILKNSSCFKVVSSVCQNSRRH